MEYSDHYLNKPDVPGIVSSGQILRNKYKFEQGGLLVYDSKASQAFSSSISPNSPSNLKILNPETLYSLEIPNDNTTLQFNSKFECGNLFKAIKLSDYEYNLYLKCDSNSPKHNHWYYFSVKNPRRTSITFNICNMKKNDPLYELGMTPIIWSCKANEIENLRWFRGGSNISYKQTATELFTLKFTYNFKYEYDTVYFAYAQPYSYTDLSIFLNCIKAQHQSIARVSKLCETNGKLVCEYLTITNSIEDYLDSDAESREINEMAKYVNKYKKFKQNLWKKKIGDKHITKKAVVLMGRIHSGETVSSFMIQGAIEFLLNPCKTAEFLRKNFVFKIVPMLNPDGVNAGNYRCCLNGVDLNRKWLNPDKNKYPTVYFAKMMVFALASRHQLMMVCDFHGHTKKKNIFMYGCSVKPENYQEARDNLLARTVPYYLYLHNSFFSFRQSHFRVEKYKESTSRIVFFKEFKIPHSYTMEASFFGAEGKTTHFTQDDLKGIGKDLCKFCVSFIKNQLYLSIISSTNNYLLRHRQKYQKIKNTSFDEKILETTKTNDKPADLSENEILSSIVGQDTSEVLIPICDISKESLHSHSSDSNFQDNINENSFWADVEIAKCLPDADSSGSDSEISEPDNIEEKKLDTSLPLSKNSKIISLSRQKIKEKEKFIKKDEKIRNKSEPKTASGLQLSGNKKISDILNLQTFKFPKTEDSKKYKMFEPLRGSVNLKNFKKSSKSPITDKKTSLSFLPVLVTLNKLQNDSKKTNNYRFFEGISEQLSRYISQTSRFSSKRWVYT